MPRATSRADQPFEIRKSAIQGRGAFATRRLRPGQFVVEYLGEHIHPDEGERRYEESGMGRHHTFLFTLDDETVVDGNRKGNDARYINHACDPNCEAVIEDGHINIYAKRNIQPGTELNYDYRYERQPAHTAEDEAFYRCLCGSPKCRGSILLPAKKARAKKSGGKKAGARKR